MKDCSVVAKRLSDTVRHIPQWAYSSAALGAGLVWSFGGLATRMANKSDAWQYLIWRSLGIIVVIEALQRFRPRNQKAERPAVIRAFTSGKPTIAACFSLLVASLGFVYALKNTTAANAAFLASLTPLIAVFLARIFLHERLTLVTFVAMAIALSGLAIMVVADLGVGNMRGNLSAVASAVGFAFYTICVRSNRTQDWSPVMPGYALMLIVVCSTVALANGKPLVPPANDVFWAVLHGGLFIVVGTSLFNLAARHTPAVAMTIFAQTETVFVPFWIFLAFDETPKIATLFGGVLILGAVIGKAIAEARLSGPATLPV